MQSLTDVVHWAVEDVNLRPEAVINTQREKAVGKKEFDMFGVDFLILKHHVATTVDE